MINEKMKMKKPSKRQIINAFQKSIEHWNENIQLLKKIDLNKNWFFRNCSSSSCAVCELYKHCEGCRLNDYYHGHCCTEWRNFNLKYFHRNMLNPITEEHREDIIKSAIDLKNRLQLELQKLKSK